jgi:hypothetical protein
MGSSAPLIVETKPLDEAGGPWVAKAKTMIPARASAAGRMRQ